MSAEEVELARRFVACKGWAWLPGMREADGDRIVAVDNRDVCLAEEGATCDDNYATWVPQTNCVPDLSDALTRAGLLPVVRRAWGDSRAHLVVHETNVMGEDGRNLVPARWWALADGTGVTFVIDDRRFLAGPSEMHALLAALEAAPGV